MKITKLERRALVVALLALFLAGPIGSPVVLAADDEEAAKAEWQDRYHELMTRVESLRARYEAQSLAYRKSRKRSVPRGEEREALRIEVERLEQELAAAEQELADFPDEARRAGALPGWFR
jgi:hypothetical protein